MTTVKGTVATKNTATAIANTDGVIVIARDGVATTVSTELAIVVEIETRRDQKGTVVTGIGTAIETKTVKEIGIVNTAADAVAAKIASGTAIEIEIEIAVTAIETGIVTATATRKTVIAAVARLLLSHLKRMQHLLQKTAKPNLPRKMSRNHQLVNPRMLTQRWILRSIPRINPKLMPTLTLRLMLKLIL